MRRNINRRGFLTGGARIAGAAALAMGLEEKILLAQAGSTSSPQAGSATAEAEKKAESASGLAMGQIGKVKISRLICGGNLFNGYAHSRDLIYVSELLKKYFSDEKIIETLEICEENGINTVIANNRKDENSIRVLRKYWDERGGKIQWLAQSNPDPKDIKSNIQVAIDNGAVGAFVQGNIADVSTRDGKMDFLGQCVDFIKQNGLIAGIGGHSLRTPMKCEEAGIKPDFYMKTFHSTNYWSQKRPDQDMEVIDNYKVDNYWDITPDETKAFMQKVNRPWLAYKVLAAGAIHPRNGFKYAFENGADFIVAGMFDFQVREDVIITKDVLSKVTTRQRPWCG